MMDDWGNALERAGYALIETHVSRVFLRDGDVYKTKRAVSLGFLDFSTAEARHRACEAEVMLNRRLAPDVYVGVVALVRDASGTLSFVPEERLEATPVLEWAVHMRRLSEGDRADVLLARGALGDEDLRRIAEMLAAFHARVRSDASTAQFGAPAVIMRNVEENFAQVRDRIPAYVTPEELEALASAQRAFLAAQWALLEERARAGFSRDGHGDLRLEHLYRTPTGGFLAIDCIEFNDRFRYADVCADLAFLTMDLTVHGRPDLAELLAAYYAEASQDYGLYALLDFYQSYRALVRAKVALLLAGDPDVTQAARDRGGRDVRRYFLVALAAERPPLVRPRLIVTFGLIASGKSTLAAALQARLRIPIVSTDRVRKHLLNLAPTAPRRDPVFAGAYDDAQTANVYDALRARAAQVLRTGRSVVVDGSFRTREQRARLLQVAELLGVDALFVECTCARPIVLERLARRALAPSVSDGRAEIYDAFAATYEAPEELPSDTLARLDTAQPLARVLDAVLSRL